MKLWLLKPREEDKLWEPWYDKAFGFVVRAETEARARELAEEMAGNESREGRQQFAWKDPEHSTCQELLPEGEETVVLRDFAQV